MLMHNKESSFWFAVGLVLATTTCLFLPPVRASSYPSPLGLYLEPWFHYCDTETNLVKHGQTIRTTSNPNLLWAEFLFYPKIGSEPANRTVGTIDLTTGRVTKGPPPSEVTVSFPPNKTSNEDYNLSVDLNTSVATLIKNNDTAQSVSFVLEKEPSFQMGDAHFFVSNRTNRAHVFYDTRYPYNCSERKDNCQQVKRMAASIDLTTSPAQAVFSEFDYGIALEEEGEPTTHAMTQLYDDIQVAGIENGSCRAPYAGWFFYGDGTRPPQTIIFHDNIRVAVSNTGGDDPRNFTAFRILQTKANFKLGKDPCVEPSLELVVCYGDPGLDVVTGLSVQEFWVQTGEPIRTIDLDVFQIWQEIAGVSSPPFITPTGVPSTPPETDPTNATTTAVPTWTPVASSTTIPKATPPTDLPAPLTSQEEPASAETAAPSLLRSPNNDELTSVADSAYSASNAAVTIVVTLLCFLIGS